MPGGKHVNMQAWAPEEDQVILDMVLQEGPKWSRIVQQLPGRTVSSVRNRWQRIEKGRKLREAGVESKNRCHACGEPKRGHICYQKLRGGPQVDLRASMPSGPGPCSLSHRVHPDTLRIAHQLAPPAVASLLQQLPSSHPLSQFAAPPSQLHPSQLHPSALPHSQLHPSQLDPSQLYLSQLRPSQRLHSQLPLGLRGKAPPGPTVLRRTRSQTLIDVAGGASSSGASLFPPPDAISREASEVAGSAPAGESSTGYQHPISQGLTVDVAAAQPFPRLERSNTSFFNSLSQEEQFSPSTRELFEVWADSPGKQPLPPGVAAAFLSRADAPSVLKRIASGGQHTAPILTRSVSEYLARSLSSDTSGYGGMGAALPPLSSFPGPAPASAASLPNGAPPSFAARSPPPSAMLRAPSMTAAELQLDIHSLQDGLHSSHSSGLHRSESGGLHSSHSGGLHSSHSGGLHRSDSAGIHSSHSGGLHSPTQGPMPELKRRRSSRLSGSIDLLD